jgi:DNA-binding transcriptional LysR family regulator
MGITAETAGNEGLRAVPLGRQQMVVALPPGTPTPARALTPTELAGHPIVATPRGTSTRELLDDALAAAGAHADFAVVTAQREAVMPLVVAGAGATLLPEPLAGVAARLGAVVVPMRPRVTRAVVAVHRDGPLSPAAQAFLEGALVSARGAPGDRRRATPGTHR